MDLALKPSEAAELMMQLRNLSKELLPGAVKYSIYKNIDILFNYSKTFVSTREDMFKQYGVTRDDQFFIPQIIKEGDEEKPNPHYAKYMTEVEPLDVEATIYDLKELPVAVFNGEQEFEGDLELVYKHMLKE